MWTNSRMASLRSPHDRGLWFDRGYYLGMSHGYDRALEMLNDVEASRESRGETVQPEAGNIREFPAALDDDLGMVCNSADIDGCAVHGIGTPWRREWNRTHPQDGSPDDTY